MAQVPNMSQTYEKLTVQPPQSLSDPLDVQAPSIPFVKQDKPFSLQLTIGQDHLTEEKPGIYFEMNAGLMAGSQKVKSESENLLNLSGLFSDDWSILISLPTIKEANQVANELRQLKENVPQEEESVIGMILTQLMFDFDVHVRDNNIVIQVVNKHPQFEGVTEMAKQMTEPFTDVLEQEIFINNKLTLAKGINEIVQENALPIMQICSGLSFQTCLSLPQN